MAEIITYQMGDSCTLYESDALSVLRTLKDNSVDSAVLDPPASIMFMGRKWDSDKGGRSQWVAWLQEIMTEVLRVVKPGGHALVWAIPRRQHWTMLALEDAGWEIRDVIYHAQGQGFPKSTDVAKQIDKLYGAERENKFADSITRFAGPSGNKKCEVCGKWLVSGSPCQCPRPQDAEVTPEAQQWSGWGSALKPVIEPWVLCRKPISEKNIALNVLKWGTGAINIDATRVELNGEVIPINVLEEWSGFGQKVEPEYVATENTKGRWPGNLVHDGSAEVTSLFPNNPTKHISGPSMCDEEANTWGGTFQRNRGARGYTDEGSNARFFPSLPPTAEDFVAARLIYFAKINKKDREEGCENLPTKMQDMSNGAQIHGEDYDKGQDIGLNRVIARKNTHPTVKSTALMSWLCRLITPPGGLVLDPFMGSGSTGKAAVLEGFRFIGIEKEAEYIPITQARIAYAQKLVVEHIAEEPMSIFDLEYRTAYDSQST